MSEQRLPDYIGYNTKVGKLLDLKAITPLILSHEQDGIFLPFAEEVKLMQYSGLNDIEGKKIYEDFILDNEVAIWIVVFSEGAFCAKMKGSTSEKHIALRALQGGKIIGNLHQNPELLK